MNTEPWVTAEQVAQHLGVVKDTVYRWRERKGLPAHKIGRLWKFQLSEIDEWVRVGGADEDSEHRNVDHTAAPEAGSRNKLIRNSTAEFLIFTGQAGEQSIEARYDEVEPLLSAVTRWRRK